MTRIVLKKEIEDVLEKISTADLITELEKGFMAYSAGNVVVPPVGHLSFRQPPGDTHIKYGYIENDDYYVIKIASGFYDNPGLGLSSSNGLILIFSQKTGELLAVLLDEGLLTDIRTAIAGAVCARRLAPENPQSIGIVGTGIQARLQLRYLKEVTQCRDVIAWGRNEAHLQAYIDEMHAEEWNIESATDLESLVRSCRLIVTCTPSKTPLIPAASIQNGTHITAVGSDTSGKQELEAKAFGLANIIIADSVSQCSDHGELSFALKAHIITKDTIVELGRFISNDRKRSDDRQISIADLTGVAVQDIQIAKMIWNHLRSDA